VLGFGFGFDFYFNSSELKVGLKVLEENGREGIKIPLSSRGTYLSNKVISPAMILDA
jgi:hypothetical protein